MGLTEFFLHNGTPLRAMILIVRSLAQEVFMTAYDVFELQSVLSDIHDQLDIICLIALCGAALLMFIGLYKFIRMFF